jgi:hypothetical protein
VAVTLPIIPVPTTPTKVAVGEKEPIVENGNSDIVASPNMTTP